jgi:hypothetical protein
MAGRELQRNTPSSFCGLYHLLGKQERLTPLPYSLIHFVQPRQVPQSLVQLVPDEGPSSQHWRQALSRLGEQEYYFMETRTQCLLPPVSQPHSQIRKRSPWPLSNPPSLCS